RGHAGDRERRGVVDSTLRRTLRFQERVMGMIEDTMEELRSSIGKAHEALRRELSRIRTGRASADLLDSIRVDYYGTPTPIAQMASISVPEPRLLTIKPWERNQLRAIEK